jgi:hypothetical protein
MLLRSPNAAITSSLVMAESIGPDAGLATGGHYPFDKQHPAPIGHRLAATLQDRGGLPVIHAD